MANPQKENGHVDIANEIVEALAKTYLSSYESQVLWAIFRKTYGWHKKEDRINGSQLSKMTGISESHVSRTLKGLTRRNIIIRNGKKISFQKDYEQWEKLPIQASMKKLPIQDKKLPIQASEVTYSGKKKLPIQVYTKETKRNYTKETIQKESVDSSNKKSKKENDPLEFSFEDKCWWGLYDWRIKMYQGAFPMLTVNYLFNDKWKTKFLDDPSKYKKMIKEKYKGDISKLVWAWLMQEKKFYIKDHLEYEERG